MNQAAHNEFLITKAAAIRRLVNAAIIMFFRDDDDLAIHCVAHAALSVAQEILTKLGVDVHGTNLAMGVLAMLQSAVNNELTEADNLKRLNKTVAELSPEFINFLKTTNIAEFNVDLQGYDPKPFWREFRSNYNFLKHGRTDEGALLDQDKIDNNQVIMMAVSACAHLEIPISVEMIVYFRYWQASNPFLPLADNEIKMVEYFREHNIEQRKLLGRYLIDDHLHFLE